MIEKQLNTKKTSNKDYDYSHLIMVEPEDYQNQLRQQIIKSAHKKVKGQSIPNQTQKEKYIQKQAELILTQAKEYPEANSTFNSIRDDFINLKQYSDVKMAVFENTISGSSGDEIQPIIQPVDDVIVMAAGQPQIMQFHIIGKIQTPENIRIQPKIKIIQSFKGAKTPQIQALHKVGQYIIYKLTISSMTRKYTIVAQSEDTELSCGQIAFQSKKDGRLLLQRGFSFNFIKKQSSHLSQLEQILIFSVFKDTQVEALKNKISTIKLSKISTHLIDSFCKIQSKYYFYELLLLLVEKTQLSDKKSISPEILTVYKLLGKAYMQENYPPFIDEGQGHLKYQLFVNLVQIILYSVDKQLLTGRENTELIKKLFKDIKEEYKDDSFLIILERFNMSQCPFLSEIFNYKELMNDYIRGLCSNVEDQLAAEILASIYYFKIHQKTNKQMPIKMILEGITLIDFKPKMEKASKNLNLYTPLLFEIISRKNVIKPRDLKPDYLLKLIRLYPLLKKLQSGSQKVPNEIDAEIKQYLNRQASKYIKDEQYFDLMLQIFRQLCLNPDISTYFFNQQTINKQFPKRIQAILTNLRSNEDKCLIKINSMLILQAIRKQVPVAACFKKYEEVLKKKDRKIALRILDSGLTNQFFELQRNENQFDQILQPILNHFYKDHNIYKQDWNFSFMFCPHINEKILECLITLKKKNLGKLDYSCFLDSIHTIIQTENRLRNQDRERLQIIVLGQKMQIDVAHIREYLQKEEKLYLKILLNIKSKQSHQKRTEVVMAISTIQSEIQKKQYTFDQVCRMFPKTQKDKSRFIRLITQKAYRNLYEQQQFLKGKFDKIEKVKKCVQCMKLKFSAIPEQEVRKICEQIDQSLRLMKQRPINQLNTIKSFPEFNENLLNLYHFPFFFDKMPTNDMNNLNLVIQKSGEKINEIISKFKKFVGGLDNNQISFEEYDYFDLDHLSSIQLEQIIKICYPLILPQNQSNKIMKVVELTKILAFYRQVAISINNLIQNNKKWKDQLKNNLDQFIKFVKSAQNRQEKRIISIKAISGNIDILMEILSKLKITPSKKQINELTTNLPLENVYSKLESLKSLQKSQISIILCLVLITQRFTQLQKLKNIQGSITYIKQTFIDNTDPNVSLGYSQLSSYNIVMKFFKNSIIPNLLPAGDPLKLIDNINEIIQKDNYKSEELFIRRLLSLTDKTDQFQDCFKRLKDSSHMESVNIKKLVQNSRVYIVLDNLNQNFSMKIQVQMKENQFEEKQFAQLQKFKDEAYIIKNKASQCQQQEERVTIIRKVQVFLKMYELLQKTQQVIRELLDNGYVLFKSQEIVLNIKNQNLIEMQRFYEKMLESSKKWDQSLKQIYGFSYKATMIKGEKFKQLYFLLKAFKSLPLAQFQKVFKQKLGDIQRFRNIVKETDIFKGILSNLRKKTFSKEQNPDTCLELVKEFFKQLKNQTQKVIKPAADRNDNYVDIFRFSETDKDFFYCLSEMKKQKIQNLQQGQMIACKKDTTKQELDSFLQRTIRDHDNQYFLLNYDNLSQDLQSHMTNKIEESMKKGVNRLKLCLAGTETTNSVYRLFASKNLMNTTNIKSANEMRADPKVFIQQLKKRINDEKYLGFVRVYTSSYPGLGKTYTIQKQIKKLKHEVIYFPISGRTSTEKLYNRLTEMLLPYQDVFYSIIFQLYEIQNQSIDIVNDFIRQIIVFRSFQYMSKFCECKKNTRVYLQIQDERLVKLLPFLKLLHEKYNQLIFVNIEKFDLGKIQVKIQDNKLCYILEHLQSYDKNTLDGKDLPKIVDFKPKVMGKQLLKKYFVDAYPKHLELTYYQFKYWIDLFYESCASFSGSFQISHKFFSEDYPPAMIKKYGLQKLRSQFFRVLLDNSIQFLTFSVQNLMKSSFDQDKNKDNQKKNNLGQIPFFLVPNNQCQWFSFIFKQTSHIPKAIRSFLISQSAMMPDNQKKSYEILQKQIFEQQELIKLENQNRKQFETKLQMTLRDISGMNSYNMKNDPQYVMNIDNFIKFCLISFKMKVNIPMLIQGEAGVGKTALLRHLIQQVFQYQFIPHTVNAGVTEQDLRKKIQDAYKKYNEIELLNKDKDIKKKVCIFFDQFNTLPQLGYIKEIMMEHRFMGEQKSFFKNLIVFAACNPYRNSKSAAKPKNQADKKQVAANLAFTVKRPPISMGQIMWNFGALSEEQMNKYIIKMLSQIEKDLSGKQFVHLICQIQNGLNSIQFGSANLRDIERFRQLYTWLREKMPLQSKIPLTPALSKDYSNLALRAYIVTLNLTYLTRINSKGKQSKINQLITKNPNISLQKIKQYKQFEEDDFCSRLIIKFEGISLNSALKENLYSIFICIMKCLPILIIGSPGCSKSLATRIIGDNLKYNNSKGDKWLQNFPRINQFYLQGSQGCKTEIVEKRFVQVKRFMQQQQKNNKKPTDRKIPLLVFDEMGLAEKSLDNPLKAIHEPLQLSANTHKNKNKGQRSFAFLGISNNDLDLSKMSRFLILRRPDIGLEDLKRTGRQISKGIFKDTNFNHTNIENYIDTFSQTYEQFLRQWKQQEGQKSEAFKNFFGLRDFYNLIRTFGDIILSQQDKNTLEKIDQICDLAMYRNLNGMPNSYERFRDKFYRKLKKEVPKVDHHVLDETIQSLGKKSRRYPLVIVEDSTAQSIFQYNVKRKFENNQFAHGSPFPNDERNSEYIAKCLTQIVQYVKSDKKMIANQLNKTAEGALFDLFNKFFIKRDNNEYYRVAMESGYTTQEIVHPNFNASIILHKDELSKQSPAFLNRFEKYQFSVNDLNLPKLNEMCQKLKKILMEIQEQCNKFELGHYKLEHLFLNYSNNTLRSLVYKELLQVQKTKQDDKAIIKRCIEALTRVATKDFQYIMKYIFCKSEWKQSDYFKQFEQGLQNKAKSLKQCSTAIIITTDQNIWVSNKKNDSTIYLREYKTQKQLLKQITQYMKSQIYKDGTLYIDFSREGGNLNDKIAFFKENQTRIEVSYILYLINKCRKELKKRNQQQKFNNKFKIILNYNRINNQSFTEIPFILPCMIFSLDGSNQIENKSKLFQNTNMRKIIDQCVKSFNFNIDQVETTQPIKNILKEFNSEISKNEGIFSQCCKDALIILQGDNIQISEEDYQSVLKNKQYLKKYNSITTALTKQYFESRFKTPIVMLLKTLINEKILLNYGDKTKESLLSNFIECGNEFNNNIEDKNTEKIKKFMMGMAKKKIQSVKSKYKNLRYDDELTLQENKFVQAELKMPTFFPYSSIELQILFDAQFKKKIIDLASDNQKLDVGYTQFEEEYYKKIENKGFTKELFSLYKQLTRGSNKYWKKMFMADVVTILLKMSKISTKYTFQIVNQIQNQFMPEYQNKFFKKLITIIGNFEVWASAFRIFHILAHNSMTKLMPKCKDLKSSTVASQLLSFINKMIPFTIGSVRAIRSNNDEMNEKLKIYSQIHHSISFQIQNLVNSKLLQKNNNTYMEVAMTEQFVTIWQTIYEKNPTIDFSKNLGQLAGKKLFFKFSVLEQFFNSILDKMKLGVDNIIYEYLANKLYPKWFNYCQHQEDIQLVFNKFYNICERNAFFAHNSTGSIQIALASLDIKYTYGKFSKEIQQLRSSTFRSQIVNLKRKMLMKIGQKCQQKRYQDNLSVLITNMIYMKLIRNNTLIEDPQRGFTKSDLQRGFENFKGFYQQLLQGSNPIFKLLAFSYIKIYLSMYISINDPVDGTCIEIDKMLCEDNQISKQLRFYCLKILRTKLNAKEISQQYIKIGTYKWCNQFKQQMKQQTSRAIEVPKIPDQLLNKELEQKIQQFKKYQGRDVNFLDDIINLGSQNIGGRYTVLNFFAKYLYTMAYNKQYQAKIIDHVKSKQAQYSAKIGPEEYKLILRYTVSKFDEKYFVEKHEAFDQGQFIILNNINWIYASKTALSPIHSLFFSNGKIIQSIDKQISQSFVPCGPENPFITTAKVVYNDTRNCNVGVYICCSTCDYIYSHLNCGWPNQKIQCVMCGQDIGGAGGHKLCRVDKGARRLISPKFIDKSMFYIYNLVGFGQEFWDAQRYYILAEMNRMKLNKSVKLKPLVNKKRIEQEQILTGYNMTLANNRIGTSTSKVIMLCIQSSLYSLVSLDIIKPDQCQVLFGSNQKAVVLDKLNNNIKNLIKQLKEVVSLNSKFYTWMFGIQAQIYKLLINFQKNFDSYVDKLEKQAFAVAKSLQAKIPALNTVQYKQLYGDLARVIENGLTVKQFRQIKEKKQMSSRNQFTRQVFEEKVQEIVSSFLLEGKLAFVESRFQQQGKMQFPFDVMLTQSKYDPKVYPFSRILKVPSEPITFEKISNKYEIVIRDKYPILDYLFKNSITFNSLRSFKKVVQACNIFLENINMKLTRSYSKSYKLQQFNKQMCSDKVNIPDFTVNWKKISTFMGPVQVNCKIFGKMNDDIQASTPIYDFLLDKELKKNYNGNIIVGIFHNFANLHNETLTILKTRKNQIQKYSKMNLFIEGYKKNPQLLTDEDCIEINEAEIMDKILQASVPSIIYGQDLVYHNFDSCEAYFLHKLKGKCELEPDIAKYRSVRFVGEVFSRVSPDTKVTAVGDVRDAVYEQLEESKKQMIKQWLEDQTEVYKYLVYGQMQLLINKMSDNTEYLKKNDQSIGSYIEAHCSNLKLDHIKGYPVGEMNLGEIVSVFQVMESVIRPILKYKKAIPEQFRKQMKGEDIVAIKQLLTNLAQQQSDEKPTAQQLCTAIQNYVYRTLLSEYMEEGKVMEDILYNQGYWPPGYDIYTKNIILSQCQALMNLAPANMVALMTLIEQFVKY